ncbi:hypothetical protein tb265_15750 [Gemmatimonadetes bacterium T265]|nr:hypothetical protein tb265_15750 [Gemmatimonadetes bacterium T265]
MTRPTDPHLLPRLLRHTSYRLKNGAERIDEILLRRTLRGLGAPTVARVPTWTTLRELRALFDLAVNCPDGAKVLEIGSYLGASSCVLASGLAQRRGHLFCVDTWHNNTIPGGERDTFAEFSRNTEAFRRVITPIRKRSDQLCAVDVRVPLSLVFLDGDHSYDAVSAEVALVTPWIADGGTLAFHDAVAFEGVARTIGDALASGLWQFSGHVDNLVWLRRVRWSEPGYTPPTAHA